MLNIIILGSIWFAAGQGVLFAEKSDSTFINIQESAIEAIHFDNYILLRFPIENKNDKSAIAEVQFSIIDYNDSILTRTTNNIIIKKGTNEYEFVIPLKTDLTILVNQRLAYTVKTKDARIIGRVALYSIVQALETRLTGSRELYIGSQARYHIFANKYPSRTALPSVIVTLMTVIDNDTVRLGEGISNAKGIATIYFQTPETEGTHKLLVKSSSEYGENLLIENIIIKKGVNIYVVTDKPIYQPGQTIYVRALALARHHRTPIVNQKAQLNIYDARDNRVFKSSVMTDSFGVFAGVFQLADEINYGTYKIEAKIEKDASVRAVEVKPYVLPKFRIVFETEKEFFKPGETVTGEITAVYFFGKKVANGKVTIKVFKDDVEPSQFTNISGHTDKNGSFEFSVTLPSHFIGQPFEQGQARVRFEISVIDGAQHEEKITESVVVTKEDIVVTVLPEYDVLIPDCENTFFIITLYPNGEPVKTECHMTAKKGTCGARTVMTDNRGLVKIMAIPDQNGALELDINVFDESGHAVHTVYIHPSKSFESYVRLLPDCALYRVGDVLKITCLSSEKVGVMFTDMLRDKQVVGSAICDLSNGRAEISFPLSTDHAGLLRIHGYMVTKTGQIVRDVRLVYVDPVNDLRIRAVPDKATYEPADDALLRFFITDANDNPVAACLGISIVDEAVFALSEMYPGLEKVYFILEEELMTPRFEIHEFGAVDVVKYESEKYNYDTKDRESRELAGELLLSGLTKTLDGWLDVRSNIQKRMVFTRHLAISRINSDTYNIAQELNKFHNNIKSIANDRILAQAFAEIDSSLLIDPWGTPYKKNITKSKNDWNIRLHTAGPDELFGTSDDFLGHDVYIFSHVVNELQAYEYLIIESTPSDWGKLTGRVVDEKTGEPIVGADVIIMGTELGAATDEKGEYTIHFVPPGTYNVVCSYISYDPFTYTDVQVIQSHTTVLSFHMRPTVVTMEHVTVTAERQMIVVSKTSTDRAITTRKLDRLAITMVGSTPQPRVRKYFPETFLFEPQIITDQNGTAERRFKLPDNITTWRTSMIASSRTGQLGSGLCSLNVFQEFFVDIDLPVLLTCDDEISLPVAVYNYTKKTINAIVELEQANWFQLIGTHRKELMIEKENVGVVHFRIRAVEFGKQKILAKAYALGSSDAIQKQITVVPNGQKQNSIISSTFGQDVSHSIDFPDGTIPGSQSFCVKLYSGIISQLSDGLEGLLRMPFGCFEQTTSITYPNVLILDYLRRAGKRNPEIEMKALEYISIGYQRLVSYEVSGGGFSWWGNSPANQLLTAYGIMQFQDMNKVFEVDEYVIERTVRWLLNKQRADGSWGLDEYYAHQEVWGKYAHAEVLPTAFVLWALLEAGINDTRIQRAVVYLKKHISVCTDPYALAIIANALALYDAQDTQLQHVFNKLYDTVIYDGNKAYWSPKMSSMTNARGSGVVTETSSLICLALLRSGTRLDLAQKIINFLNESRNPNGGWSTTQGTVFALKALLEAELVKSRQVNAEVNIVLNGIPVSNIKITPENSDVIQMIELKDGVEISGNDVRIEMRGSGSLQYDIVSTYYRSWDHVMPPPKPMLVISHTYNKTQLTTNDIITSGVSIENNSSAAMNMVIVDLGIPPGFDVIESDLRHLVTQGVFQKYQLTPRQIIVYYDNIPSSGISTFTYQLKPRFPMKVQTGHSRVYDYYNPDVSGVSKPRFLQVVD